MRAPWNIRASWNGDSTKYPKTKYNRQKITDEVFPRLFIPRQNTTPMKQCAKKNPKTFYSQ